MSKRGGTKMANWQEAILRGAILQEVGRMGRVRQSDLVHCLFPRHTRVLGPREVKRALNHLSRAGLLSKTVHKEWESVPNRSAKFGGYNTCVRHVATYRLLPPHGKVRVTT